MIFIHYLLLLSVVPGADTICNFESYQDRMTNEIIEFPIMRWSLYRKLRFICNLAVLLLSVMLSVLHSSGT